MERDATADLLVAVRHPLLISLVRVGSSVLVAPGRSLRVAS